MAKECVAGSTSSFLWHRHLSDSDSSGELGAKYRSFLAACAVGPVDSSVPDEKLGPAGVGASELEESDKQEIKKAQEQLMTLRRSSVSFHCLEDCGGASGAQYTQAQLNKHGKRSNRDTSFPGRRVSAELLSSPPTCTPQT